MKKQAHGMQIFFVIMICSLVLCGCSIKAAAISTEKLHDGGAAMHVFSHRGACGEEEESTIASYDLAVMYGTRWIEMDLVTSMNGSLWVSHDETAERMTGDPRKFAEMTDAEIGALRTYGGASILTIDEILERYAEQKNVGFNIAIRDTLWDTQWDGLQEILDKYCSKDEGFCNRLIIQAQLAKTLQDVKDYNEEIITLFLATDMDIYNDIMRDDDALQYIDIIAVNSFYMDKCNQNMIDEVHEKGKYYAVFTLNTTNDIKDAIERGIDYYFTDFTAKALLLEDMYR